MPYTRFNALWKNAPDATTPITAAALDYIEGGIVTATALGEGAPTKALLTTKGDIYVATAAGILVRQGIGAEDTVPASEAASSTGITWKKVTNAMIASAAGVNISKLEGYPTDATRALKGDGTWGMPGSYGTSLPGSPYDGQEYTLSDSLSAPTYRWRLRYNISSSSTYKWEFVGGTPMFHLIGAESSASSTYVDLATVGPSITVPRAGDYRFEWGAFVLQSGSGGGNAQMAMHKNNVDQSLMAATVASTVAGTYTTAAMQWNFNGLAASDIMKVKYLITNALSTTWNQRYMYCTPIRVS